MRRKKTVTLRDIADDLGLTVHTVSKALRGLPGMSEETRKDVFETARRRGYRTKEQAISQWYERVPRLITSGKRFFMILPGDTPFNQLLLSGLHDRLHEMGHTVTAVLIPKAIADREQLQAWVDNSGLMYSDGLVIAPSVPEWMEAMLLALPIPKVLINFPPMLASVDSVIWDVEHAIHQSVERFVTHGHTRILYIGDNKLHRGFRLRWTAFQAAMQRWLNIDVQAEDHMTDPRADWESWGRQLDALLERSGCTAILCAIDYDLQPVMFYLQSHGKRVPADYSVICLETLSPAAVPHIARPQLHLRECGSRAAERLLWRIANPDAPSEQIRISGGFIDGETVARLRDGRGRG